MKSISWIRYGSSIDMWPHVVSHFVTRSIWRFISTGLTTFWLIGAKETVILVIFHNKSRHWILITAIFLLCRYTETTPFVIKNTGKYASFGTWPANYFFYLFLGNLKLNQIYLFNKILPKLNAGADSLNITHELSI